MKTVGSILKEARQNKKLTLDKVELETKIRRKFLEALESDNLSALPSVSYAKGFIRNYAHYLNLNSDTVMAFFRRQSKEISRSQILPKNADKELKESFFRLTPKRFLTLMVMFLISLFLVYFGFQYQRLQKSPMLRIESPVEGYITSEKLVPVKGRTDPDATLSINGVNSILDTSGNFFEQIGLKEGTNKLEITATSRYGKKISVSRNIKYEPKSEP